MNADEPAEPSPFAAFAAPKRSAAEEYQERQRKAAATRRTLLGCALAGLVGAVCGATACAASAANLDGVLTALVGSLIVAAGGTLVGAILGAVCFGAISATTTRARTIGNEFVRRDPMAALRGLMFAWSLIGAAIGAKLGAEEGARWAGAAASPLSRWSMAGSLAGLGFGLVVWFFTLRRVQSRA